MAAVLVLAAGSKLTAQVVNDVSSTSAANDQVVVMSPFTLTAQQTGRYVSTESTSGGRVRSDIMDASQAVSVVTHDLIEDIGAPSVLSAAKYVSGIAESTIPNDADRVTIRGFQSDGQTADGMFTDGQAMLDPVFIDRIEVVKGPDAILAPTSVPGGTINIVTKKPQYTDFGSIDLQVGVFDADRAEFDYNRVINPNFAFRVVGAYQNTRDWAGAPYRESAIMPMITYHNEHGAEITLQIQTQDWHEQDYFGVPIDPSAGTLTGAHILSGIPRDLDYDGDTYRFDQRPAEFRLIATTPITDALSVRIAGHYVKMSDGWIQALAGPTTGGAVNPYTGDFTPGIAYGPGPTYTPMPATPQPSTLTRAGYGDRDERVYGDFQNDWVYDLKLPHIDSSSQAGFSYEYVQYDERQEAISTNPINFTAPTPTVAVIGAPNLLQNSTTGRTQVYVRENLSLFDDRVVLNAGYSDVNFNLTLNDDIANKRYEATVDRGLVSYGIVVKPLKYVSLYFGHEQNSSANSAQTITNGGPQTQDGTQDEGGIRVELLDKRLFATFDYFHIIQNNFSIGNPANNAVPPPVPTLPALYSDRLAKGWEFELRAVITPELSLIGNATSFTNRDPNNIPIRGAPEKSGAIWANYTFNKASVFHGLSAGIGSDYEAKRPGDQGSGLTALNVPIQPSFYLPARTVTNAMISYRLNQHWKAQVNVDNLFNTKYLQSSLSRFDVWPGPPINGRLTVTYSF